MANLNAVFKDEINRIARKVVRSQMQSLKSNGASHRRSIARLKREVATLRRELAGLRRRAGTATAAAASPAEDGAKVRFSGRSVASQRKRLGLSAAGFAKLLGVTGQTVYNWEKGKRPRAAQLAAIAELRSIGRREAQQRLEAAPAATPKRARRGGAKRRAKGRARR